MEKVREARMDRRSERRWQDLAMLLRTEGSRKGGPACTGSVYSMSGDTGHTIALVHHWKTHGIISDVTRTCGGRHTLYFLTDFTSNVNVSHRLLNPLATQS